MDADRWKRLREIFDAALDLAEDKRPRFLTDQCGDDVELRSEIEELLDVDEQRPMSEPTLALPAWIAPEELRLDADTRIGPFRIRKLIASGGMGHVYEAEQEEPRRRIALKIMRSSLASEADLSRFRYEAETLAKLQHPNVAQVFAVGTYHFPEGPSGELPYFAMELIEHGRTLLQYAEAEVLSLEDRLALFGQVCEAIHYGHLRGVLHRDIKPANVLVGTDGRVKVIDFGLAKAIEGDGASLTQQGRIVGTPSYMAPEQFESGSLDVRSDVYALGVVLYELLVGQLPRDFSGTPLFEILRSVRDNPPRPPSDFGPVPKELEWIVLRAIESEPERRYSSATALGDDIARFLRHEPVSAGPPSTWYRARKFVRRHRLPVAASALVVIALVGGLIGVSLALAEVREQFEQKQQAVGFFTDLFSDVNPEVDGRDARLFDVVERWAPRIDTDFPDQPAVRLLLHHAVGQVFENLGFPRIAEPHLETANALSIRLEGTETTWREGPAMSLASCRFQSGRLEDAETLARQVLAARRRHFGEDDLRTALATKLVGLVRRERGDFREARDLLRRAYATTRRVDPAGAHSLRIAAHLGGILVTLAEYDAAEQILLPAFERSRSETTNPVARLAVLNHLAVLRLEQSRFDEARRLLEAGLAESEDAYGTDHPERLRLRHNLGRALAALGRNDEARDLLEDVIDRLRAQFGDDYLDTHQAKASYATLLYRTGEREEAERLALEVGDGLGSAAGWAHPATVSVANLLTVLLTERGALEEAEQRIAETLENAEPALGVHHPAVLQSRINLAAIRLKQNRSAEAETILEEVLATRRAMPGELGPGDLTLLNNLARAALDQNRPERAEAVLDELLKVAEAHRLGDHPTVVAARSNLASVLGASGRRDEAIEQHRAILAIRERTLGIDHPSTILSLNNLGVNLQKRDRLDEAMEVYERAAQAIERTPIMDPVQAAQCLFNYGALMVRQGRGTEAEAVFVRCVSTFEEHLGPDSAWTRDSKTYLDQVRSWND